MLAQRLIPFLPATGFIGRYYPQTRHVSTSVAISMDQLIKTYGQNRCEQYSSTLQQMGFSKQRSISILLKCPQITSISTNRLEQQFLNIKSLGFKDEEIKEIITKEPQTLIQNPTHFRRSLIFLLKELGEQDGRKAVVRSPTILNESHITVNEKISYFLTEMGLPKSGIAKTGILELDIDLIKVRHTIAYRAGYYKKPNKKKPEVSEGNPSFSELYQTSDEDFIKKMKGISLEELFVLETMINNEDLDNNESENEEDEGEEVNGEANFFHEVMKINSFDCFCLICERCNNIVRAFESRVSLFVPSKNSTVPQHVYWNSFGMD